MSRVRLLFLAVLLAPATGAAAPAQAVSGHRSTRVAAADGLVEARLADLRFALRTGQVTSEELVRGYLERIQAYDEGFPFLNGILALDPTALEQARARDAERAQGLAVGRLHGIPVLVKDNVDVAGMPTTAGSLALAQSFPPDDAHLVRRLRAHGAVVIGKATLTEFANFLTTGMPNGYSSLGGHGLNPYGPLTAPDGSAVVDTGGSSSGSGIAVAASLVPVAVGTETSGSILSPSGRNCLVGIKPTIGLISRDGIVPITADQDTAGPMARSVADAALLLGVLAGYDPADPVTEVHLERGLVPAEYTRFLDKHALDGARIAVPRQPYWSVLSPARRDRMREVLAILRAQGAEVLNLEIPDQGALSARGIAVTYPPLPNSSTVLLYGFKRDLNAYLAGLGPLAPMRSLSDVIAFNEAGAPATVLYGQSIALAAERMDTAPGSRDTQRYEEDRALDVALFRGALDALFAGPDGLAGNADDVDAALFPENFGADAPARAGYPSICVPARLLPPSGAAVNDIPFGVTFTGPAFSEPRLVALAYSYEQASRFRVPPPGLGPLPDDPLLR